MFRIPTPKEIRGWSLKKLLVEYRVAIRVIQEQRSANERQAGEITRLRAENEDLRNTADVRAVEFSALNQKYNNLFSQIGAERDATRKQVRVLRLVEFAGERADVEQQVRQSIHGTVDARNGRVIITAVTLHEYPEILQVARMAPSVLVTPDGSLEGAAAKGSNNPSRDRR